MIYNLIDLWSRAAYGAALLFFLSPRRGFVRNLYFVGRGSIAFHPCLMSAVPTWARREGTPLGVTGY